MLLNLFFFTITISKRTFTNDELEKAFRRNCTDTHLESKKAKPLEQTIRFM